VKGEIIVKIEKIERSERKITATFTQSEWNELCAGFGTARVGDRDKWLASEHKQGLMGDGMELFEFLLSEMA
jgi:hypothetical protein